jgi:hypothetical protein
VLPFARTLRALSAWTYEIYLASHPYQRLLRCPHHGHRGHLDLVYHLGHQILGAVLLELQKPVLRRRLDVVLRRRLDVVLRRLDVVLRRLDEVLHRGAVRRLDVVRRLDAVDPCPG